MDTDLGRLRAVSCAVLFIAASQGIGCSQRGGAVPRMDATNAVALSEDAPATAVEAAAVVAKRRRERHGEADLHHANHTAAVHSAVDDGAAPLQAEPGGLHGSREPYALRLAGAVYCEVDVAGRPMSPTAPVAASP